LFEEKSAFSCPKEKLKNKIKLKTINDFIIRIIEYISINEKTGVKVA